MSLIIFWSSIALIAYSFILFPILVYLYGNLKPRPFQSADHTPNVSMVIAAHNEARNIRQRIENILEQDYPHDCLEVIIASDGSTDQTNTIVREYSDRGIRLLVLPRIGKIPALNAAVAAATGDILVFSDANSMYARDAVRVLVRPFADPQVGGVAGNQQYLPKNGAAGATRDGELSYWNFDRLLKRFQSRAGNVISAPGSIYAVRRSLFRPIPGGVTDDFVASTRVISLGYRLVFAPDALAYEPAAGSSGVEFGRKVRIITQGFRSVLAMRQLLNPFRYGFYAIQVFSHKVLRRLVVFPLLALFLVNPLLWSQGVIFKAAMLAQVAFYGLALLAIPLQNTRLGRIKLLTIPYFFCVVYAASFVATIYLLRGIRIDRWEPQRQEAGEGWASMSTPPGQGSA